MKQIGLAIQQYIQDNDERYPAIYGQTNSAQSCWAAQIMPYVNNKQIFKCPSDPMKPLSTTLDVLSYAANINVLRATSTALGTGVDTYYTPVHITQLTAPALTVQVFESRYRQADLDTIQTSGNATDWANIGQGGNANVLGATGVMDNCANPANATAWDDCDDGSDGDASSATWTSGGGDRFINKLSRHLEGSNFLAADGHVKFLQPKNVCAGINATVAAGACGLSTGFTATQNYPAESVNYSGADKHGLTFSRG
jgi:prepilin-type processing-associated H-X9-DG protein